MVGRLLEAVINFHINKSVGNKEGKIVESFISYFRGWRDSSQNKKWTSKYVTLISAKSFNSNQYMSGVGAE